MDVSVIGRIRPGGLTFQSTTVLRAAGPSPLLIGMRRGILPLVVKPVMSDISVNSETTELA
jgi:hypothetical protein